MRVDWADWKRLIDHQIRDLYLQTQNLRNHVNDLTDDLDERVAELEDAATEPVPQPTSCPEHYRSFGRQTPCSREQGHPGAHRHGEVQWY